MVSYGPISAPQSVDLQQQQAQAPDNISMTTSGEGEAFTRVDNLENQLRGMILKNQSPLIGNATAGTLRSEGSPKAPKAAEVTPHPKKYGSSEPREDDKHRGRGRRPNQAQRRQMKKVDLKDVSAIPQQGTNPSGGNVATPKEYQPRHDQVQNAPHSINMATKAQAQTVQARQTNQDQQPFVNQLRNVPIRPGTFPAPNQQPHIQDPRFFRASAPHLGFRQNPVPFPQSRPMPPQNHLNGQTLPHPHSLAPHPGPQVGQYSRPIAPNRQLYQGDRPQSNYQQRSNWGPHPDIAAQSAFVHAIGEVVYRNAKIPLEELEEKESLRLKLQTVFAKAVSEFESNRDSNFVGTVNLACFGSLRSGFATCGSDMDLALVCPTLTPDPASAESEVPRLLEKTLLNLGYGARLLTRTRVPIIRFCEQPTPELLEALVENRAKWEKEKDAPRKLKKAKKAPSKAKPTASHSETNGETREATTFPANAIGPETRTLDVIPCAKAPNDDEGKKLPTTMTSESHAKVIGSQVNDSEASVTSRTDDELVYLYKLAIQEGWFEHPERVLIVKFIEAVKLHGADGDHESLVELRRQLYKLPDVLSRYRVPTESHLDYPKTGVGIQCDINFSNHLALHNTRLLKCYSLCDPRVRPMVIVIKAWTKSRKINSSYHGTLSSYGYVLMALHYLMNVVQPPVIPNLQIVPQASSPESDYGLNGYNVCFWQSEEEILEAARRGQLTRNHADTVGSLLRGFFQYYAHPHTGGFSWASDVISLRTPGGILRKEEKGWTGAKTVTIESTVPGEDAKEVRHRYLFAIEDPFELEHNVARTVVHNGIVAIRDEFRRATKIIQARGIRKTGDDDLFAEAASKENLQRKFFGPLIKPFVVGERLKKHEGPTSHSEKDHKSANREIRGKKADGECDKTITPILSSDPTVPEIPVEGEHGLSTGEIDDDSTIVGSLSTADTDVTSSTDGEIVMAEESITPSEIENIEGQ